MVTHRPPSRVPPAETPPRPARRSTTSCGGPCPTCGVECRYRARSSACTSVATDTRSPAVPHNHRHQHPAELDSHLACDSTQRTRPQRSRNAWPATHAGFQLHFTPPRVADSTSRSAGPPSRPTARSPPPKPPPGATAPPPATSGPLGTDQPRRHQPRHRGTVPQTRADREEPRELRLHQTAQRQRMAHTTRRPNPTHHHRTRRPPLRGPNYKSTLSAHDGVGGTRRSPHGVAMWLRAV